MTRYVRVAPSEEESKDSSEITELPLEDDDTLLLTTVCATFANAIGLKYRHETGSLRGLRLANECFSPPDEGWDSATFFCVYAKVDMKRKGAALDEEIAGKRVDTKCCDLIVLGLAFSATEEELSAYFSQFGTLALCFIKRDVQEDKSKGFAFIKFNEYTAQQKVLSQRHLICKKWCDVKIPNSRLEREGLEAPKIQFRIYVGRCTEALTADVLREYFSQFGVITEVYIPRPFKACAFITFQEARVAKSLIDEEHVIKGVVVHTSTADQLHKKPNMSPSPYQPWKAGSQTQSGNPRMEEDSRPINFGTRGPPPPVYKPPVQSQPSSNYGNYGGENSNPIANLPNDMFSAIANALYQEARSKGTYNLLLKRVNLCLKSCFVDTAFDWIESLLAPSYFYTDNGRIRGMEEEVDREAVLKVIGVGEVRIIPQVISKMVETLLNDIVTSSATL
ncbi:unnamed protein product [Notodromas monacha]|uniref:RRM domain-containing protein n=1 Tax=Notodromas monacha TaxID=399045 RepID=A0A7R9BSQ0_9CRUS|nr:unnamed protein product [Notodromas monacha]CAG0921022.1 unnamed protein product [Notodromas monacha]